MNTNPLAPLRPRLDKLIDAVLADWDDPTMTGARISARHGITPEQLEAIARLPRFRETLARLDAIRDLRRPHVEARARSDLFRSLNTIIHQDPTTASKAKEIRLAIKQLLALMPNPGAGSDQDAGAGGWGDQPPDRATPDAVRTSNPPRASEPRPTTSTPNPAPPKPPHTRPSKPSPAAALLAGAGTALSFT